MNKCKLHYFRSVGKFFVFFEHEIVKRSRNVALAYNVLACSWWRMRLVDSATCYKRLLTAVYFTKL